MQIYHQFPPMHSGANFNQHQAAIIQRNQQFNPVFDPNPRYNPMSSYRGL